MELSVCCINYHILHKFKTNRKNKIKTNKI